MIGQLRLCQGLLAQGALLAGFGKFYAPDLVKICKVMGSFGLAQCMMAGGLATSVGSLVHTWRSQLYFRGKQETQYVAIL